MTKMLNIRNELCVEFGWFGMYSYRLGRVQFNVTGTHKKSRRVKFIIAGTHKRSRRVKFILTFKKHEDYVAKIHSRWFITTV